MPTVEHELITATDAAARLNVSHSTVARAARNGEIPYVQRVGDGPRAAYLFDPDVIEAERKRRLAKQREIVNALEGGE